MMSISDTIHKDKDPLHIKKTHYGIFRFESVLVGYIF